MSLVEIILDENLQSLTLLPEIVYLSNSSKRIHTREYLQILEYSYGLNKNFYLEHMQCMLHY